jgi:endonuclease/exonuclease/phosphatase family metal-dependent hydrolase
MMALRVLTWNLMHGRAVPNAGHDLLDEFVAALERWDWDVAVLQEVPPWWPPALGARLGAATRAVLTSRNAAPGVRRAIAVRAPDLIRSHGGGANAILVRGYARIAEHRTRRLCLYPERRMLHAVGLSSGWWIGNLHCSTSPARAIREATLAASTTLGWAAGARTVLAGDFNVRSLALSGFQEVAAAGVDHVLAGPGLCDADVTPAMLERGRLSDHAPMAVALADQAR